MKALIMAVYESENVNIWIVFISDLIQEFARPFLNLVLIALFFFFIVRPLIGWLKREMEPLGSGTEAPVLPEYSGSGNFRDNLPLPTSPSGGNEVNAILEADIKEVDDPSFEASPPNYDEMEEEAIRIIDPASLPLTYGNLSRDNILPLARDNMERTVELMRAWISSQPPDNSKM